MSTDLALRSGGPPAPEQWATYKEMTTLFLDTEFVPKGLRGRKEAVLAAIVSGHELGIGPMQALKHIAIVDGKPAPSAELMVALVRRAGHSIQGSVSDSQATCHGKRHDNGDEFSVTWTMDMAGRAGLRNKHNWKSYPEAMLWARAVSQLCRTLFPDVIAGMGHTPEELGATLDEDGQVIEAQVVESPKPAAAAGGAESPQPAPELDDALPLCPHCGNDCKRWQSNNPAAPKWRCTNSECTGHINTKTGEKQPWVSWHDDPWKPGGEVDKIKNSGELTDAGSQPTPRPQTDAVPVASPEQTNGQREAPEQGAKPPSVGKPGSAPADYLTFLTSLPFKDVKTTARQVVIDRQKGERVITRIEQLADLDDEVLAEIASRLSGQEAMSV
jgi:hypothetical protein